MAQQQILWTVQAFPFDEKYYVYFIITLEPAGILYRVVDFDFEDLNQAENFLNEGVADVVEAGFAITTINGEECAEAHPRPRLEIPCVVQLTNNGKSEC